jgi:histidine triad (HIT) family protein
MSSVFTKILNGDHFALLDINPLANGHTLVIPKQEVDYIFEIEDERLANYFLFAKKVAAAIKENVNCKRIGMSVIGLEVPHTHIHLVPLNTMDDINFSKQRVEMNQEEFIVLANAIQKSFTGLDPDSDE